MAPDSNLALFSSRGWPDSFGLPPPLSAEWRRTGQATGRTLVTCAKLKTVAKFNKAGPTQMLIHKALILDDKMINIGSKSRTF